MFVQQSQNIRLHISFDKTQIAKSLEYFFLDSITMSKKNYETIKCISIMPIRLHQQQPYAIDKIHNFFFNQPNIDDIVWRKLMDWKTSTILTIAKKKWEIDQAPYWFQSIFRKIIMTIGLERWYFGSYLKKLKCFSTSTH